LYISWNLIFSKINSVKIILLIILIFSHCYVYIVSSITLKSNFIKERRNICMDIFQLKNYVCLYIFIHIHVKNFLLRIKCKFCRLKSLQNLCLIIFARALGMRITVTMLATSCSNVSVKIPLLIKTSKIWFHSSN